MISLKNIKKNYILDSGQQVEALKNINLDINKGEIFGVIGLSGAGKSTLIRIINMLECPTSGNVLVNGVEMTTLNEAGLRKARRSIGMIFQQFNLLSSLTAADNIAFPLTLDKSQDKTRIKKRVKELLEMVEIGDKADSYPSQLSGGQKQRVGIARALATSPQILLCDEATSALDPKTTESILQLLKDLRSRLGLTIVIITHQMEVIKQCCDRVAVLDQGVISEMGKTIDLFANPQKDLTKRLAAAAVRGDIADLLEHLPLLPDYQEGARAVCELLFLGEHADDPVIVRTAVKCGTYISILAGSISHIQQEPLGILIAEIAGTRTQIDITLKELAGTVHKVSLLGYVLKGRRS